MLKLVKLEMYLGPRYFLDEARRRNKNYIGACIPPKENFQAERTEKNSHFKMYKEKWPALQLCGTVQPDSATPLQILV